MVSVQLVALAVQAAPPLREQQAPLALLQTLQRAIRRGSL